MFDRLESAGHAPCFPMASKKATAAAPAKADLQRAERLVRLRKAFGYETASAFAAFLDVSKQRWGHCERGLPLGIDLATRVVRSLPGVTLDYLYFGKVEGLPLELARRLGLLERTGK